MQFTTWFGSFPKSMLKICHISNFWSQIKKVLLPKNYRLLFNTNRDFLLLDIYNSALFSAPTKASYFLSEKILHSTEIYFANLDISWTIFCLPTFFNNKNIDQNCVIFYIFLDMNILGWQHLLISFPINMLTLKAIKIRKKAISKKAFKTYSTLKCLNLKN